MPTGNKRSEFKNKSARLLADLFENEFGALPLDPNSKKFITEQDIQKCYDGQYWFVNGRAIYNKKNVAKEKRFDTNLIAYTENEFKNEYGKHNYKIHWDRAITYKPVEFYPFPNEFPN